jgi:hypothetical protein
MASQIDPTTIDVSYPIAGQDNDTRGFHDNYRAIQNGLVFARAEISDLQPNSLPVLGPYYTGNFAAGNITVSGNITAANLIVTSVSYINQEYITTTDFIAGNAAISGNLVANSGAQSTSVTSGALVVTGGTGISGNLNVGGNVVFSGTRVAHDAGTITVYDSIIDLHTYGNLAAWASDDGKDIGLRLHYYNGGDRLAFLGLENSTRTLQFLSNATETSSNVTGTFGNAQMGSLLLSNTTISSSTATGALIVAGGAGIAGALYIANTGDVSANIGTLYLGNVSAQSNLGAYQTYANANAATQQTQINSLVSTANANVAAYLITATGNISANTLTMSSVVQFANLTTTQINAISPANRGMTAFNYTTGNIQVYNGTKWANITLS